VLFRPRMFAAFAVLSAVKLLCRRGALFADNHFFCGDRAGVDMALELSDLFVCGDSRVARK
jgi:hypothetical protein